MAGEKVLIGARSFQGLEGEHRKVLTDAGLAIVPSGIDRALSASELAARLPGMSALISGMDDVSAEALQAADELRVISMNGAGLDRIDVDAATRLGIVVTNTPGTNADSVADLTFALMLGLARDIVAHDDVVRRGDWTREPGIELHGRTLGLVGLGNVGKAVARRAVAFGMRVMAFDPFIDESFCEELGIRDECLDTLLTESDVLSLHCGRKPGAECLVNPEFLSKMKPGALLVNTSRGELVDEEALADALESGPLAGAGLDVFGSEPPVNSRLLGMENVVLTPHIGGYTLEAALRTALQAALNVVAVLRGGEPDMVANPEVLKR